jgi:Phosphopantetheine attachment site.
MNATSNSTQSYSAQEIQDWITSKLAAELQVETSAIDVHQPFVGFGIDSIAIFTLTGDLAEWLGHDLRATLLWEYPNIAALSQHLSQAS